MEGENWQIEEGKRIKHFMVKAIGAVVIGAAIGYFCSLLDFPHVREVTLLSGLAAFFLWDGIKSKYSESSKEGPSQPKGNDEDLSRQYVLQVFAVGRETCPSIAEALRTTTQGDVVFSVSDDASIEISLAILGTSLAVLKGHSQVMSADRGAKVEGFCKRSIEADYDLPAETADELNASLDEYQDAFHKSMSNKSNPFSDISGIMLCRCLGPRAMELCLPGTGSLNPFIHQVVSDLMTMTVTQTMTFWKGK